MSAIETRPGSTTPLRAAVAVVLVVAMCLFGVGVYRAASFFKGTTAAVQRPTDATGPVLPGAIYVVQSGAIYRFANGSFRQITPEDGWMQPSPAPEGSLFVAVKRSVNVSNLFVLGQAGRLYLQLTRDDSQTVETSHWAFYPRYSPDGSSIYFSYDPKDPYNSYRVDLAIFATSATSPSAPAVQWTEPNQYTGGDVSPIPLRKGGLLYTKFSIDTQFVVHSQIWFQTRPGSPGVGLTRQEDDCSQPAISRDESTIAMVCRQGSLQSADLAVAPFDASTPAVGSPSVVAHGQLVASPSFSPDGKLIAFLAPDQGGGPFQLWSVSPSAATTHSARQITKNLALDPTSAPAWVATVA